ncbi:MAG TPA: GGDEF domain-containing response regulator [Cyanothece sp. UBA12306]|nr:GGDEF domain-containing response regulator [Cyanothece sp. UBA12306]
MTNPDADNTPSKILIVDDKPTNLRILSTILTKKGYKVQPVDSGELAIKAAQNYLPDLILLDINMPDLDGYQVCKILQANEETSQIPIIFLSALQDGEDKMKAFQAGGVDYITKPFQFEEVLARVSTHLALQATRRQLRELNIKLEQQVEERTKALKAAQKQIIHDAYHDPLTGLPNRSLFLERIKDSLQKLREEKDYLFAVLSLDLDRFKVINESDGHSVGDRLLIAISRKLETLVRTTDTVARLGGDEFAILLEQISDVNEAIKTTQIIKEQFILPFRLKERDIFTTPSIGLTISSPKYNQPEEVLRDADIAMARAKRKGRGRYEIFDQDMHTEALKLLNLETDLRRAIENQEFVVYYQPIMDLENPALIGFEALIRWFHPKKGFISPGEFIPVAEETGLIIPIGQIVLIEACRQLKAWQQEFPQTQNLTMSVNLSSQQLKEPEIIKQIDSSLEITNLNPSCLKLEITESLLMENAEVATTILMQLKERKIKISLDDFGTGYSSLSYLHRFPVDTLKIDRSFVHCIGTPEQNLTIIQSIMALAHNLDMDVVAEGIETEKQLIFLKSLECEFGQGFYFSKPLPADEISQHFF